MCPKLVSMIQNELEAGKNRLTPSISDPQCSRSVQCPNLIRNLFSWTDLESRCPESSWLVAQIHDMQHCGSGGKNKSWRYLYWWFLSKNSLICLLGCVCRNSPLDKNWLNSPLHWTSQRFSRLPPFYPSLMKINI